MIPPLKMAFPPLSHAIPPPVKNPEKFSPPIHFSERGGNLSPSLILTQGKPCPVRYILFPKQAVTQYTQDYLFLSSTFDYIFS